MKNHVSKFGQFINEMAKGDYFSTGKGDVYGMHKGGSSDWSRTPPEEEPDEELDADEFMSRYGDEVDSESFNNYRRTWDPDTKVKVWKGMERDGWKIAKKKSAIEKMSDRQLKNMYDGLKNNLQKTRSNQDVDPRIRKSIVELFMAAKKELMLRKASK